MGLAFLSAFMAVNTTESGLANKLALASAFTFKKMNLMNCLLPMNVKYPFNVAHTISFLADFWRTKLKKHQAIDSRHPNEALLTPWLTPSTTDTQTHD